MSLVMRICGRIQVLDFGTTIASGTPEEIANHPKVIEAYLGRDEDDGGEGQERGRDGNQECREVGKDA